MINIKNKCLDPIALPNQMPRKYKDYKVFRCGKCPACLRQKANELIVRSNEEWQGRSLYFLTFTYRYESCPIYNVDWYFKDGLKVYESSWLSRDTDLSFNLNAPYQQVEDKDGNLTKRFMPIMTTNQELFPLISSIDEVTHVSYKYWTIDSGDMQKLIKRFRKVYPDVLKSYIYVPEYGGLTYHPHFHMMVFGLSEEHVKWFADNWNYGNVDIDFPGKNKKYKNVPIHEQAEKISRYVAKYCSKGKYDCPFIADGLCLKPRRSVSQNFGIPDFDKLKKYLLATEYTGIVDPFFDDDCPPLLDERSLKVLVSRRKWDINGYDYPVPKYFIDKVFRRSISVLAYKNVGKELYKNFDVKPFKSNYRYVRKKQVSSLLQKEIGHYILADLVNDFDRQLQENTIDSATNMDNFALARNFENEQKANLKAAELQFTQELQKSIF